MTDKRWGLKHEGRDFIVHQETREAAVELFAKYIGEVFRLVAVPPIEDIEAGVHELGPDDMPAGRVVVDKNPARETRHAHVEPEAKKLNGASETTLEQIQHGAKSVT